MKIASLAMAFSLLVMLAGCYVAPVIPPQGLLFSNVESVIDTDTDRTNLGARQGEASSIAILGLFAFGKASVAEAAEDGRIDVINHVDYQFLNVLGLFQRFTIIAYGD